MRMISDERIFFGTSNLNFQKWFKVSFTNKLSKTSEAPVCSYVNMFKCEEWCTSLHDS